MPCRDDPCLVNQSSRSVGWFGHKMAPHGAGGRGQEEPGSRSRRGQEHHGPSSQVAGGGWLASEPIQTGALGRDGYYMTTTTHISQFIAC